MSYFRLFLTLWAAASLVDGQSTVSSCLYTMEQLITEESSVTDYSVTREYIFCENRLMLLGQFDMNNVQVDGSGSPPFPVRPNMHVRCGESGGRENNCVVSGGDIQVDGTSYFGAGSDLDLSNVIFEGFTFESTSRYSVWATKKGDITFIDCEWKDITDAYAPIFFDYYDASDLESTLKISFIGCNFQNIVYLGDGAYPAIITANGDQNQLLIDRSNFESNDFINNNTQFETNSYLIQSSGTLTLTLNCFKNNSVGVSPAAAFGVSVVSENNFGVDSNGTKCDFLSNFETLDQFDAFSPTCNEYETDVRCLSDTTDMPSVPPSGFPSTTPPSATPTSPTGAPSGSMIPSEIPSWNPTGEPVSIKPTSDKTPEPTTTRAGSDAFSIKFFGSILVSLLVVVASNLLD